MSLKKSFEQVVKELSHFPLLTKLCDVHAETSLDRIILMVFSFFVVTGIRACSIFLFL